MFLGGFIPFENFHSFGDVTLSTGQRLKFAIWPLSSEGSLACHTYCDTRHLFIMVISDRHGININNLIHFFSSFSSCPTFPSIPSYCKLKREPGECCEKPVCEFSQQHGSFTGTGSTSGKGVGKLW